MINDDSTYTCSLNNDFSSLIKRPTDATLLE